MCIAIVNKHSLLTEDIFKNSFDNNPDGAGMAFINKGKISVIKEMKSYLNLYNKYVKVRQNNELPILIHFRIGTSGIKDKRNVHPFMINKDMCLIHNGMIDYQIINKDYSDTWHFTQLLKSLKSPERLLNTSSIENAMFEAFTTGSKVAFLHSSGQFSILNEESGMWVGDTWFSNDTYKECDYYNYGGKVIYKSLYDYEEKEYSSLWKYEDLLKWKDNLIDAYSLFELLPESSIDFDSNNYVTKVMYILSLSYCIYGDFFEGKSYQAIEEVRKLTGATTFIEMYDHLYELFVLTNLHAYEDI